MVLLSVLSNILVNLEPFTRVGSPCSFCNPSHSTLPYFSVVTHALFCLVNIRVTRKCSRTTSWLLCWGAQKSRRMNKELRRYHTAPFHAVKRLRLSFCNAHLCKKIRSRLWRVTEVQEQNLFSTELRRDCWRYKRRYPDAWMAASRQHQELLQTSFAVPSTEPEDPDPHTEMRISEHSFPKGWGHSFSVVLYCRDTVAGLWYIMTDCCCLPFHIWESFGTKTISTDFHRRMQQMSSLLTPIREFQLVNFHLCNFFVESPFLNLVVQKK